MKIIQKAALCLFTLTAFSPWNAVFAAELEVNFVNGAQYAGVITGKANFVGADSAANITLSGSVTDDVKMTTGTLTVASVAPFGGGIIMNGGNLHIASVFSRSLTMLAPSTLTLDVDSAVAATGAFPLVLAGAGKPTLGIMENGIVSSVSQLKINAASQAGALVSVAAAKVLANPSAELVALTVLGDLDASTSGVTGATLGTVMVGGKLNLGGNAWNKSVTVV